MNKEAQLAITKARVQLLVENPFLGTLALSSELVQVDDNDPRGPASTDGTSVYYSPSFWLGLTDKQRKGVLAHEIAHNALLHSARLKGRDHDRFNKACDYAINELLVNTFNFELPSDVLLDKQYYELSAEEIYDRLPESPLGQKPKQGWGEVLPTQGSTPEEQAKKEAEMRDSVAAASRAARAAGKLPGKLA